MTPRRQVGSPPHDAIVCRVPSHVNLPHNASTGELHVSVSLNAQQYTSRVELDVWWPPSTARLDLYEAPTATSISPSTGPALGGTRIVVAGTNLTGGSNYTCRFGDSAFVPHSQQPWVALPGTLAGSGMRCAACLRRMSSGRASDPAWRATPSRRARIPSTCHPTGRTTSPARRPSSVSCAFGSPSWWPSPPIRGRAPAARSWCCRGCFPRSVEAPIIAAASLAPPSYHHPLRRPRCPRLRLAAGMRRRVAKRPAGDAPGPFANFTLVSSTVPASFDASTGVVRCYTPSLSQPTATLVANLTVSLNGQQYHGGTQPGVAHLTFDFFGAPTLSAVSPTCGPTSGATLLTISGEQLGRGSHYLCRFGERAGAARRGARPLRIDASTAAKYEAASGSVTCRTPPGLHAVHFSTSRCR